MLVKVWIFTVKREAEYGYILGIKYFLGTNAGVIKNLKEWAYKKA
jgi:hypothetical protein